jgi:hypothetical protein
MNTNNGSSSDNTPRYNLININLFLQRLNQIFDAEQIGDSCDISPLKNSQSIISSRKLSLESDDRDKLPDKYGIINLNIGGKLYATTLETLRKDSNSMLYAMFSGLYKVTKDGNGAYFIDRDGKYFRYILNYLR